MCQLARRPERISALWVFILKGETTYTNDGYFADLVCLRWKHSDGDMIFVPEVSRRCWRMKSCDTILHTEPHEFFIHVSLQWLHYFLGRLKLIQPKKVIR